MNEIIAYIRGLLDGSEKNYDNSDVVIFCILEKLISEDFLSDCALTEKAKDLFKEFEEIV